MIESLFGTLRHFFGNFFVNLKSVQDPRDQNRITYPLSCLLFTGILMFLCRLGSRRQIRFSLNGPAVAEKYEALFSVSSIPHGDTLEALLPIVHRSSWRGCYRHHGELNSQESSLSLPSIGSLFPGCPGWHRNAVLSPTPLSTLPVAEVW